MPVSYTHLGDTDKIADDTWHNDNDCVHACILPCSTIHGMLDLDNHTPLRLDAAMPVMHGKYGEDGTVQGLLELAGIPIIGCTTMSSALCMDKVRSHSVVSAAGIDIPWGVVIDSPADIAAAPVSYTHLSSSKVSLKKIFPFFILFFVLASVVTTVFNLPATITNPLKELSKFFIIMAMAAIGLNTDIVKLVKTGGKPIFMGLCCWVGIAAVSLLMQHLLGIW